MSESIDELVSLGINGGKDSYTIEKQLAPGEQIWANVGETIRKQIPDKDGKTIPPDVMMGSYELRDLDHRGVGYLYEGKLVIDKTWGHGYYGCGGCCGYKAAALNPNPSSGMINTYGYDSVDGEDCTNTWYDFTGESYSWGSANASIATLANPQTHFVGVGSTSGYAHVQLESNHVPCNVYTFQPQSPQNTVPCPTSVSSGTPQKINWTPGQGPCSANPLDVVGCITGVGADVQMTLGPSNENFNNGQLTESLSQASTTCPPAVLKLTGNICTAQPGPIVVGIKATDPSGTPLPAANNAFWDVHAFFASQDILGVAGVSGSCTVVCNQTYSCAGKPLSPSFTITYTLTHATNSSGTPVTQVTVAKAAK